MPKRKASHAAIEFALSLLGISRRRIWTSREGPWWVGGASAFSIGHDGRQIIVEDLTTEPPAEAIVIYPKQVADKVNSALDNAEKQWESGVSNVWGLKR